MTICNDLRQAVLQAAIQGKLSSSYESDTKAIDALNCAIKNKLDEKHIKRQKIKIIEEDIPDDLSLNIPNHWIFTKLGNICNMFGRIGFRGYTKNDLVDKGNGAISLSPSNITKKGEISFSVCTYLSYDKYYESPEIMVENGDIILVKTGSSYGKSCIVKDLPVEATINPQLVRIIPYINSKFLHYVLQSNYADGLFKSFVTGTATPTFSQEKLLNIIIPLPPIEEQQRIVDKVEELMAKIDELEKTEQTLESIKSAFPDDMKAAILQAAMQGKLTEQLDTDDDVLDIFKAIGKKAKPVDVSDESIYDFPPAWMHINLLDAANLYTGNSISESVKNAKYTGIKEGYDYIGTKDVGFDHIITYNNGVRIPETESGFRYAYTGATLLCIEGGSAGKKIGMIDRTVCFGNKLCAFNPVVINPKFLYYYIQSPLFTNEFKNSISGMIGGVSINKIKKMSMPLPSLAEQQRIVEKLDKLLPLCDNLNTLTSL